MSSRSEAQREVCSLLRYLTEATDQRIGQLMVNTCCNPGRSGTVDVRGLFYVTDEVLAEKLRLYRSQLDVNVHQRQPEDEEDVEGVGGGP